MRRAVGVLFFVGGVVVSSIGAGAQSLDACPAQLTCEKAQAELVVLRGELLQWKKQIDAGEDLAALSADELEEKIAELGRLSRCDRCPRRLRSEALQVQSGMEGIVAKQYDRWGMQRGRDARRSFCAAREATRVDPDDLAAWTSYGRSLAAIGKKTMKGRIASFLKIDLVKEMEVSAANLRRLTASAKSDTRAAKAVLADLDQLLRR